jgi:cytochrome c peroxidase
LRRLNEAYRRAIRQESKTNEMVARRAPTLFNRAFGTSFFWDGRAATLEEQALLPICCASRERFA